MSFRQQKPKSCPTAICLHQRGAIRNPKFRDETDYCPEDEQLTAAGWNPTAERPDELEDALIAAIDGGDEDELPEELLADETDDLGITEDDEPAPSVEDLIIDDQIADEETDIALSQEQPERPYVGPDGRVTGGPVSTSRASVDETQLLPSRIGSRRAVIMSAADDDASARRPLTSWKDTVKTPAQHARHRRHPLRSTATAFTLAKV